MMNMTLSSSQTLEKISGIDSVTLYLIDDPPDNLMFLGDLLERVGYQDVGEEDGESGLEHAKRVQPDLIFIDGKMPGPDGFQVCERLRAQTNFQRTPIILMSAPYDSTNRELVLGVGASEFLAKTHCPRKDSE